LKIAVVILNWNGRVHLETYLPSVLEFTNTDFAEIIVADNGSTDDSIHFLKQNYPQVRLVLLDRNYGFAGGYNKALEQVDAEYFCLLNSDVRVTKGWLDPVISLFESDRSVVAIQPKILSDRDHSLFEHAGAAGGFVDKFAYPFCRGRIMNVVESDQGQYDSQSEIFWASGACLFVRANEFKKAGGFDADFFAHMEEIDLCWRFKNQGHKILYTPESKVYHWGGATLDYNNPRKLFLNIRNSLWTLYKNHTGANINWIIFVRMLIDTIAIAKYVVSLDLKNAKAIVDAHFAFHRSKVELIKKRNVLIDKVTTPNHAQILNGSIALQFFLSSKKTFDKLRNLN
jgi:GT2 family glycosyltransferase